jgi:hypothetical protein
MTRSSLNTFACHVAYHVINPSVELQSRFNQTATTEFNLHLQHLTIELFIPNRNRCPFPALAGENPRWPSLDSSITIRHLSVARDYNPYHQCNLQCPYRQCPYRQCSISSMPSPGKPKTQSTPTAEPSPSLHPVDRVIDEVDNPSSLINTPSGRIHPKP